MATATDDLYYRDWYRWAREQAGGLRRLAGERINTDLELERVAEEIDELADSRRDALRSQLRRLIVHLLKLEYSPAPEPRRQWRRSIREARAQIEDRLTTALERELRDGLAQTHARARRLAAEELKDYGEAAAAAELLRGSDYGFEDVLAEIWFPASRPGIAED